MDTVNSCCACFYIWNILNFRFRSFLNQVLNRTLSSDIFQDIFGETTDNNSVVSSFQDFIQNVKLHCYCDLINYLYALFNR